MIKKFFISVTILLALAGGYAYWSFSAKRTLITPFPYAFNTEAQKAIESEHADVQSSKILIVGDRMGAALSAYTPAIVDELAKSFKTPPKVYNWSRAHEGLHRTLFKLKSLKKIPSIVIYHGASSELYERAFSVLDSSAISKNFAAYDDERIISLIITFPWLSKVFYNKMEYFDLGPKIAEYQNQLPGPLKMQEKEISFKLFNYELRELIDLIKDSKSNLILITTPLNLEIPPKEVCSQSTSNTVIELQQEIEQMIKEGNYKTAHPKALELAGETYSNARTFYLLGQASLGLGELQMARAALQQASAFDCTAWRGNAVYNAIMKSEAKKRQVMLVDFDQYMASALSKEGLFIDDIFPQTIFYQSMLVDLMENLKKLLSVND
ncbi:MAG: hypothetical protein WC635_15235 [Bacteriovorax sp.]|jgi:hypothetical protein